MTHTPEEVNAQHMAAMGLAGETLGQQVASNAQPKTHIPNRCPSVGPNGGQCALQVGHQSSHIRGQVHWYDPDEFDPEPPTVVEPQQPTKQREGDQALPKPGRECVQDLVIAKMEESKRVGLERYGSTLQTFNGRRGIQDITEEARDFFVYLTQMEAEGDAEVETLIDVVRQALDDDWQGAQPEGLSRETAETAVRAIEGHIRARLLGVPEGITKERIYDALDDSWTNQGYATDCVAQQTAAMMDLLGLEGQ